MKQVNSNKLVIALIAILAFNASWSALHSSDSKNTQIYSTDLATKAASKDEGIERTQHYKTKATKGESTVSVVSAVKIELGKHKVSSSTVLGQWRDSSDEDSSTEALFDDLIQYQNSNNKKTGNIKVQKITINSNSGCDACGPETSVLLVKQQTSMEEILRLVDAKLKSNAEDQAKMADKSAKEKKELEEKKEKERKLAEEKKRDRAKCLINSKGEKITKAKHREERAECFIARLNEETDEKEINKIWRMARTTLLELSKSSDPAQRSLAITELNELGANFFGEEGTHDIGDQLRVMAQGAEMRNRLLDYSMKLAITDKNSWEYTRLQYALDNEILNYRKYADGYSPSGRFLQSQISGELTMLGRQVIEDPKRILRTNNSAGILSKYNLDYSDALASIAVPRVTPYNSYQFIQNLNRPNLKALPTSTGHLVRQSEHLRVGRFDAEN